MAYGFVRTVDANGGAAQSGSTATIVLTAMSAGHFVYLSLQVSSDTRNVSSLVSSDGSVFTLVLSDVDNSNIKLLLYRCPSLVGAAPTVTVTWDSSAANNVFLWADEYTGLSGASDQIGSDGNTSVASVNPTTATTTQQPDILYVTALSSNGSNARPITTPAGMAQRANLAIGANPTQRCSYDQRLTATGTQSVTVAVTGGNSSIIAVAEAFPETAGGMTLGPMFGG